MDLMVIAHTSHWLVSAAYMLPVAGFLGWLGITTFRERRNDAKTDEETNQGSD